MPFNLENLKNDKIALELYSENIAQKTNSNLTLSTNSNQNIINNRENAVDNYSRQSDENSNYHAETEIRFNNPNDEIIQNESSYRVNGPSFIIKFYPSKFSCFLTIILNIIPGGLGTMVLGINRKSLKYILGGIIHFLLIDFCVILGILLLMKKKLFTIGYKKALPIYLFIISSVFYSISIYIGIINNFVFINSKKNKKYHKKEVGLFILILNLIIPGLGTLMIQSIVPDKCLMRMKRTITGIGQLTMFVVLFLFFSGISKMNNNLLLFIFLAIVEYLYTIGTSICFLRNIIISDDIINEIEI